MISREDLRARLPPRAQRALRPGAYFERTEALFLDPWFEIGIKKKKKWYVPRFIGKELSFVFKGIGLFLRLMTLVGDAGPAQGLPQAALAVLEGPPPPGFGALLLVPHDDALSRPVSRPEYGQPRASARQFVLNERRRAQDRGGNRPVSGLGDGQNRLSQASDPRLGATAAAAAAHRARQVRRPVLSGHRRAGRPVRHDRLVRLSAPGSFATSGPRSTPFTTRNDRTPSASKSAARLSRDPRVTDNQLMEICLRPRPARACPLPARRGRLDRSRGARPASLRADRGLEPGLARLAAAASLRGGWPTGRPAATRSPTWHSKNYRSIPTR